MDFKIVADSSSNVFDLPDVPFASVPLKIITQKKEYVDDTNLDVKEMVEDLEKTPGPSRSSCPNPYEWIQAFGNAAKVFALSITSGLSGSYSSAQQAGEEYKKHHDQAQVCVIDSLSAGSEITLLIEKIRESILAGHPFEKIEQIVRNYQKHTHLLFSLKSLTNLARNGRVNPAVAKIADVLGICVVGKASDEGTLEQMHKCRGEKRALKTLLEDMLAMGFSGGKVRIAHCLNLEGAIQLKNSLLTAFPASDVKIDPCGGLCSFYAEKGGLLVGFEDG